MVPFFLTAVLLVSAMIILTPILSRAETHVISNAPLVPDGPVDGSTAETVFDVTGDGLARVVNGPLNPAGPVDGSTATASFNVTPAMVSAGAALLSGQLRITFSKSSGTCPGPGGGDDWAEEVSFWLTRPPGQ